MQPVSGHRRPRAALRSTVLLALCLSGLLSTAGEPVVTRWQGRTMGSPYTVQVAGTNLVGETLQALQAAVEARLQSVNREMSHYAPASELSKFNAAPAGTPFPVSPAFLEVVRFSLGLARESGGAFDPTLGPVINLWGFGERTVERAVPSDAALREALARTGWPHITVTQQGALLKDLDGLTLNLSAVAKGFGVDEVSRLLEARGFTNTYVAIAGEVRVRGRNPRGTAWQVGISTPVDNWRDSDPLVGVASLSDRAISTSGDYQKFFRDAQGRRLAHILDPRTGAPVQHDVAGVSVVAPDSMTADALATTLFVLGREAGLRFIEARTNAAALFILRDADGRFQTLTSSRFEAMTR